MMMQQGTTGLVITDIAFDTITYYLFEGYNPLVHILFISE